MIMVSKTVKKIALAVGAYYLYSNFTDAGFLATYKPKPAMRYQGEHKRGVTIIKANDPLPDGLTLLNESWSSSINWNNLNWRAAVRLNWMEDARLLAIYMQPDLGSYNGKTLWRYYGAVPN